MARSRTYSMSFNMGLLSLILGLAGLALCWWTPAGMILSLSGMVVGLVGCVMTWRDGWPLPAAGLIFSTAALAVCWTVAAWGLELIRLGALR
jgi:hypothetical protein